MRDPARIDRILAAIREAWETAPDYRLGQLLINAVKPRKPCPELFSVEDEQLEKLLVLQYAKREMTRHAFDVAETFEIKGLGLIIAADKTNEELPSWLALKVGDEIEFRSSESTLRTRVSGFQMTTPRIPKKTPFGFFLSAITSKIQVPLGSEVWVSEASVTDSKKDDA